jgi:UDP-N-acetyl-D-galactosamine dehydrogenase
MVNYDALKARKDRIAVVGLGYVGLPLAVYLSRPFSVVGYDLDQRRIRELQSGADRTLEVPPEQLAGAGIEYTSDPKRLSACRLIIVAVPTPIDAHRIPDLKPLRSAARTVGENLAAGSCVVFESTVYPGATEEECVPLLQQYSGMTIGRDFTVGYSPERINPGDSQHTLDSIVKVVSGSDVETCRFLARVYGEVITAGIHEVSSIKVAEAAKVIENTQRDLNIALMNELSMIFEKMGIDTMEVLTAAGTKWNFLPFQPGLVGGHCIGVDPYYLTFKAESLGYHPEMILAGRRINDGMGKYVAERAVKMLISAEKLVRQTRVAVLGITFKENVPDLRNTRVVDIIEELGDYGVKVLAHDPLADPDEAQTHLGLQLVPWERLEGVDAVVVAVAHQQYAQKGLSGIAALCTNGLPLILDLKGLFSQSDRSTVDMAYWRL